MHLLDGPRRRLLLATTTLAQAERAPFSPRAWHRYQAEPTDLDEARLAELLAAEPRLEAALAELRALGVQVLCENDDAYPPKLAERLGAEAPPVLFVAGPVAALAAPGVAVVGSREAAPEALAAAADLGEQCHRRGLVLFTGAARGADSAALGGALTAGGHAVGLPAGDLAGRIRALADELATGRLTLASPAVPWARFSAAKALERNWLVYCLAECAVVVACQAGRGGTRAGALEALQRGWTRVLVRRGPGAGSGVEELVAAGAVAVGDHDLLFGPLLFGAA